MKGLSYPQGGASPRAGAPQTCNLCPHHCRLQAGQTGFCRARMNFGGRMTSLSYGKITALALDPIEKKPLRLFHPGSVILSVGSFGCNLRCPFCQNHEISQVGLAEAAGRDLHPEQLLALAVRAKREYGSIGVAFTYNEPLTGYEYVWDAAHLLKQAGLLVVLVTNGQICATPWRRLLPFLDAVNIDLKGFRQEFYEGLGGDLETVKTAIRLAVAAQVHVEVTTLVIPGKNDSVREMERESLFLSQLSEEIPLHLSRFFPRYRELSLPPTPRETLLTLQQEAQKHLRHVFLGNI
jgi:pyruvate formate lyase activating enzyme